MTATIDLNQLVQGIKDVVSGEIKKDIRTVQGFSEHQVRAIAYQAVFITEGVNSGSISKELYEFFSQGLKDMINNFVNVLKGLIIVMLQQIYNAIVGVIWSTISKAIGFKFP